MGEGNNRVTARAILPSVLTVDQRRWLTVTYLRLRKVGWFLVVAVLTAGLVAYFGTRGVAMPTAFGAAEPVQFWRLLVVVSGIVPALMMASPVAELEAVAGADFYRYRSTLLAASFLIVSALVLLGTSLGGDGTVVERTVRALPAWLGLSLLSGRLFGWVLSWVLPWVAISAIIYWGYDGDARAYRWWEFTVQPIDHAPSAVLSVFLLATGLAAYATSPWRFASLRRRVHLGRSADAGVTSARPET